MKQVMIAVALVAAGLAVGLSLPQVFAQAPQAEVQKWEQFCEKFAQRKWMEEGNENMASHGTKGFQLVSTAVRGEMNSNVLCYRRPAR
jgi:heme oxygenase